MAVRVAINGFGRIGRLVLRGALNDPEVEFVAINDLADAATLAHLLKYDSVHGRLPVEVRAEGDTMVVGQRRIKMLAERDPANLPWRDLGVDYVVESTGLFTARDKAALHLQAGARKVVISAPGKEEDITIVMGVNHEQYDPEKHHVVSNASCTTNCLAPVAKVLDDNFGIRRGWMTTIHSYTNDQRILDLIHKDWRRARAAAMNIVPTTTGAARAVGKVLPHLQGKLDGFAVRVPTPDVSLVDLVAELDKPATPEEINDAFRRAAAGPMQGILGVADEPLVSSDFIGDPRSSIVDASLTKVMDGNLAKVVAWYDNEWGYALRCVDLIKYMHGRE
ncbi:MAG TPA: type I glyceraldehyde-3-phosphate dehydrogenase [Limnochordales bacterium]|nr:type I glyceraldehyde-3-phosphate dehydrogenase [Limnochordales bacterium]